MHLAVALGGAVEQHAQHRMQGVLVALRTLGMYMHMHMHICMHSCMHMHTIRMYVDAVCMHVGTYACIPARAW